MLIFILQFLRAFQEARVTVVAGENDSGKSTIGKLIYLVIRGLSKYKEEFEADRIELLINLTDRIYFEVRGNIGVLR
ncbi:hypothetical protein GCM10007096_35530 [Pullulanibacillus pueri]|uniref:Uncharacterized protein n=1 Tax=Pullulanibacillus pueri TaxID=1437324 RepID=A0A8J2ZYH2_9BACL|nr:hypothetical protein GCM10007096_35530 [Pullulanibacillus pueri]